MKNRQSLGFTLIELLVVTGILVAISSIIAGILYSTLRGTETTRTNTSIAQTGNYALSVMTEVVKRAKRINDINESGTFTDCVSSPTGDSIRLEMPNGSEQILYCDDTNGYIASTSAAIDVSNPPDPFPLTNPEATHLNPGTCSFTCYQANQFNPPLVEIQFELGQSNGAGGMVPGTETPFKTSINVRNFED